MSPDKIELLPDPTRNGPEGSGNGGTVSHSIRFALPYFRSMQGKYVHRVRSGATHRLRGGGEKGAIRHLSFTYWCGNVGTITMSGPGRRKEGQLFATVPEGAVLCAVCEGKAIGAGMDGARTINGKPVMFSPRK